MNDSTRPVTPVNPTGQISTVHWLRSAMSWLEEAESTDDPAHRWLFVQNAAIHVRKAIEALEIEGRS